MTAPTTACVSCGGSGITPFTLDEILATHTTAILPRLKPSPCVVCRCRCGQPNTSPGGSCGEHGGAAS